MKKSKLSPYFWKIIWIVGLCILSSLSLNYDNYIKQTTNDTLNYFPVILSNLFISIFFGIYISLIFVKKWTINLTPSLLYGVTIPCILISFSYPILITLESIIENLTFSFIPYWVLRLSSLEVFGITAGLTLILSIFNANTSREDK